MHILLKFFEVAATYLAKPARAITIDYIGGTLGLGSVSTRQTVIGIVNFVLGSVMLLSVLGILVGTYLLVRYSILIKRTGKLVNTGGNPQPLILQRGMLIQKQKNANAGIAISGVVLFLTITAFPVLILPLVSIIVFIVLSHRAGKTINAFDSEHPEVKTTAASFQQQKLAAATSSDPAYPSLLVKQAFWNKILLVSIFLFIGAALTWAVVNFVSCCAQNVTT